MMMYSMWMTHLRPSENVNSSSYKPFNMLGNQRYQHSYRCWNRRLIWECVHRSFDRRRINGCVRNVLLHMWWIYCGSLNVGSIGSDMDVISCCIASQNMLQNRRGLLLHLSKCNQFVIKLWILNMTKASYRLVSVIFFRFNRNHNCTSCGLLFFSIIIWCFNCCCCYCCLLFELKFDHIKTMCNWVIQMEKRKYFTRIVPLCTTAKGCALIRMPS